MHRDTHFEQILPYECNPKLLPYFAITHLNLMLLIIVF